jgi:hypothetical protein
MQQRGFMYHGALQERKRDFEVEDRDLMREQEIEDAERDRRWNIQDAYDTHQYNLGRDAARIAAGETSALNIDQAQRDRDRAEEMREKYEAGELDFSGTPGIEGDLNKIQSDVAQIASGNWQPWEKEQVIAEKEAEMGRLIAQGKPKKVPSLEEDFAQNVFERDGKMYVKGSDGWQRLRGDDGPQQVDPATTYKGIQSVMAEGSGATDEPKSWTGDWDAAKAEYEKRMGGLQPPEPKTALDIIGMTPGAPGATTEEPEGGGLMSKAMDAAKYLNPGYYGLKTAEKLFGDGEATTQPGPGQQKAIAAARAGDEKAQKALERRGIPWQQ